MLIRRFQPSDAGALAALFHASVREAGLRDYSPEQVKAWSPAVPKPEYFTGLATSRVVLVAVDERDQPLGYGILEDDGHIDHLYCRPGSIGSGIGAALLNAMQNEAVGRGVAVLTADASEAARRLLERRGFHLDSRHDFTLNGVAIHNYRMSKRIA